MSTPRHKQAAALPDYRKATLRNGRGAPTTEAEAEAASAHFIAVCRRGDERARLAALFSLLEPPAAIDGRKLTKAEVDAYTLAVNYARGTASQPDEFPKLAGKMAKRASARIFTVFAAAMDAVKREQAGWNETDGHRMAALQAKLELEKNLGRLPLQKQVKERAFEILMRCRWRKFSPLEPKAKRWSKILASAGLDYLPKAKRGPAAR